MQHIEKSFDAFLRGESKVAVIKGSWGVGKTYFWNKYITKKISDKKKADKKSDENLNQIAYSYISLFGKKSLSDAKKSIFHSAEPISSKTEIKKAFKGKFVSSSRLLNLTPWVNWVTRIAQNIPATGNFSNIISDFEYALVDNYVICFDDLERKAGTLTVKEIMGLIDELATRKNCKVILIFNENALDEAADKAEFNSYREKVVDIELNYEPTCVENIKLIFPDNFKCLSIIENVVNVLDIKNIRVLRKIHRAIEEFCIFSKELPDTLIEEFITHATFLCWGYFIRSKDLSFEDIKFHLNDNSLMSLGFDKEEGKTLDEEKCCQIARKLKLLSSHFDPHIIHYLEQGFVNEEKLKSTVSYLLEWVGIEQFKVKFRNAKDMYEDSLEDNLAELIAILKDILNEDMDKIEMLDFSWVINILTEFGGESVLGYIENYVELHKELLKRHDPSLLFMKRIENEDLKAKIYIIYKENKCFDIDDIAESIASHKGWMPEDIDFLASLKKSDFHTWIKGNPENLIEKVRDGLLKFGKMNAPQSNNEKFKRIYSNVRCALLDVASENALNKKRVKDIYGVE